jgi:hypothetical protein
LLLTSVIVSPDETVIVASTPVGFSIRLTVLVAAIETLMSFWVVDVNPDWVTLTVYFPTESVTKA